MNPIRHIRHLREGLLTAAMTAAIGAAGVATAQAGGLSPTELSIWNDPDFERRFAESYIAVTEVEPPFTPDEREELNKIYKLFQDNQLDDALALLEEGKNDASSALYYFMTANIHLQRDNLAGAASDYKIAVDRYPKFRRAWRNMALVMVRQGEFEQARDAFIRVIELGGADADIYGLLAYTYSSMGDSLAAESAYRMANLLDPGEKNWKMGLARSFFRQQRYADAVALCDQLIADDPDNADLWLLQANAYIGLNKPLRAAENYEIVDGIGKSTVESLSMLGDIYINEGLFGPAVTSYSRAMEMVDPDDVSPVLTRVLRASQVLSARAAVEETKSLIKRIEVLHGEQLSGDDRKALLKLRARIAVAEGASEEQVRVLQEIVALDPLDGEALILLGQHHARLNSEAVGAAQKAEAAAEAAADEAAQAADAAKQADDPKAATQAVKAAQDARQAADEAAQVVQAAQRHAAETFSKAVFHYERAAAIEAFEADAKVRHAQLLVANGRYAESLPLLRGAQKVKYRDNIQDYLKQVERVAGGR